MGSYPGRGIERHDAFFQITSHSVEFFKNRFKSTEERDLGLVRCHPHYSSFTFTSQLATINELWRVGNERWRPILLNQHHDGLKAKNMTAKADPVLQRKVDIWMDKVVKWNDRQKQVIRGIHAAKGGMMLVM
jgi:hypothetical protein